MAILSGQRWVVALCFGLFSVLGCGTNAKEDAEFSGGRFRAVWLQDQGNSSDVFAVGTNLLLKAYDSKDGTGERLLVQDAGSFSKPLFMRNGSTVIFSDRKRGTVESVSWDGASRATIVRGFALGVWRDPVGGEEWIVFAKNAEVPGARTEVKNIYRMQPGKEKEAVLLWDKTAVSPDSWHLSVDGRVAGGLFPWPDAGFADIPNGEFRRMGKGCWTALSSQAPPVLWVLDGPHRGVSMFGQDGSSWKVDVHNAPGMDGFEIYHPRWSNHARFLAVTGPYKVGNGDNKIRGGGEDVEIHVGRLDAQLGKVEKWVQVTRNRKADYYPDIWIEDGSAFAVERAFPSALAEAGDSRGWPVVRDGLIFAWENGGIRSFRFPSSQESMVEARGAAVLGRGKVMDVAGGLFAAPFLGPVLLEKVKKTGSLSVEAVLSPSRILPDGGIAYIMAFASGDGLSNFVLGQERDHVFLQIRTTMEGKDKDSGRVLLCKMNPGRKSHVQFSYSSGVLVGRLNGKEVFSTNGITGDFSNWTTQTFVFGSALDRSSNWAGTIENVAIYDRFISLEEVSPHALLAEKAWQAELPVERIELDAELVAVTTEPSLELIEPYHRALVVHSFVVRNVLEGKLPETKIRIAHWAILDRKSIGNQWEKGKTYRFSIESFDSHEELEGERIFDDTDEFSVPQFFDVGDRSQKRTCHR